MRQDVSEILDFSRLELWRHAKTHGDLQTWTAFQQSLEGTVLTWFHEHPGSEAVCRVNSERHFVSLAFGRLRQAVVQVQVVCETLSEVLDIPWEKEVCFLLSQLHLNQFTGSAQCSEQFGHGYGMWLKQWRMLQRSVFVIDLNDHIVYVEYVADRLREPDYGAAMQAVQKAVVQ
jgi:hypothetical protein